MKFCEEYNELYYKKRIHHHPKRHMIKYVRFLLGPSEKTKWLDIGCGQGFLVLEALRNDIDAYGIDISKYALENSLIIDRVRYGSITNIPFEDEMFDVISAFDVVEHVNQRDAAKAFSEMHRVLRCNGLLILTTPNPCAMGNWVYDLTHVNVRPANYWKMMLARHGFKIKMKYIPSFIKYYWRFEIPVPDGILFWLEEPLRYILGCYMSLKDRIYVFAEK